MCARASTVSVYGHVQSARASRAISTPAHRRRARRSSRQLVSDSRMCCGSTWRMWWSSLATPTVHTAVARAQRPSTPFKRGWLRWRCADEDEKRKTGDGWRCADFTITDDTNRGELTRLDSMCGAGNRGLIHIGTEVPPSYARPAA